MRLRSLAAVRTPLFGMRQLPLQSGGDASRIVTGDGLEVSGPIARQTAHSTTLQAGCGAFSTLLYVLFSVGLLLSSLLHSGAAFAAASVADLYQSPVANSAEITGMAEAAEQGVARRGVVSLNAAFAVQWRADGAADAPQYVGLPLFDGEHLVAELRSSRSLGGRRVWQGMIEGQPDSLVSLILREGRISGSIVSTGGQYRLRYRDGEQWLLEIDQSSLPQESPPITAPVPDEGGLTDSVPSEGIAAAEGAPQIDVLVLYTSAVRVAEGGEAGIRDLIDLAFLETNTIYANSGINQRIRLVHAAETSYVESTFSNDLSRLANTSEGYMDGVHALRDAYGADMVALIRQSGEYCGIGYVQKPIRASFSSYAFSVTSRTCATGYFTFGHELGHNMGATHDLHVSSSGSGAYPYSHGYVNLVGRWRTVMAYSSQCSESGVNCPKAPYFSNPDVTHNGAAVGIQNQTDNRRTLNNSAMTMAAFRDQVLTSPGELQVTPMDAWQVSAPATSLPGVSRQYVIRNTGGSALEYVIEVSSIWLSLDDDNGILEGQLLPGQSRTITATLNSDAANLSLGQHGSFIQFADITNASVQNADVEVNAIAEGSLSFPAADIVRNTDNDGDGYFSRFTLYIDADVSSGSAQVRPDIYVRPNGGNWSLFHRGAYYTVVGSQSQDWYELPFTLQSGFDTGEYDFRVELFLQGASSPSATRDNNDDDDFSNVPLERAALDAAQQDDNYEQNDTRATAYSLVNRAGTWLHTIDGPAYQHDDDWYRIRVQQPRELITVWIDHDSPDQADLALYNASGALLAESATDSDHEQIDISLTEGDYFVRVFGPNLGHEYGFVWRREGQEDNYEPNNSRQQAFPLDDYNGRWLDKANGQGWQRDEDWYRLRTPSDIGYVELSIDLVFDIDENVDLYLYDSSGNELARAINGEDSERVVMPVLGGDTFYIRLTGNGEGSYNLRWSGVQQEDNYEENDSLATAFPLDNYNGVALNDIDGVGWQLDKDWYRIRLNEDDLFLTADLADGHLMTLGLYGASGNLLQRSSDDGSGRAHVEGRYPAGYYYLLVDGDNSGDGYYGLRWSAISQDDNYESNNQRSQAFDLRNHEDEWLRDLDGRGIQRDADWYRIEVDSDQLEVGADLRLTHAEGNIDIRLRDSSGNLVAYSNTSTDREYIKHVVGQGGTYYLEVYGANRGNSYDLLWWDARASNQYLLQVSKSGSGSGSVSSSPSGISCGADCEERYVEGTQVNLQASPAAGSLFQSWQGDCSGSGSCQVSMSRARAVSAVFSRAAAQLDVTPLGGFSASGSAGGPFSPSNYAYTVHNSGNVTASVGVESTASWVTVSPSSFSITAGSSVNVSIALNGNAQQLAAGTHLETLRFRDRDNNQVIAQRSLQLSVQQLTDTLLLTPGGGFSSSGSAGGPFTPSSKTYQLMNVGNATLSYQASIDYQSGSSWLNLSGASGSISGGANRTLSVSLSSAASNLSPGQYSAELRVRNLTHGSAEARRTITLQVTGNQPAQIVFPGQTLTQAAAGSEVIVSVRYETSNGNNQLNGLGVSMHFDSSELEWLGHVPGSMYSNSLFGQDAQPLRDVDNLDGDLSTDYYLKTSWAALTGGWPGQSLPLELYRSRFRLNPNLSSGASTVVRFASNDSAPGYQFIGRPATIEAGASFTLDIDGNGQAKALTDGLLVLRYLFNFSGQTLINGAVANDATRRSAAEIEAYLSDGLGALDIDGNGQAKALTDGLLVLRYLFNFSGQTLINGAVANDATRRSAADIEAYLRQLMP